MALNPSYFTSIVLQQEFVDKDTALPLSDGVVNFWRDSARSTPKDVFYLSGSPPSYTYVNAGPSITLTSAGVFDKAYYYYPYDAEGNLDLYFVNWFSSVGVLQDTREAWPNEAAEASGESTNEQNFAVNGQFLLHDNLPATDTVKAGVIRQDTTNIAYGGWAFQRSTGSSATDIITFPRYGSYAADPTADPRYALRVQRTVQSLPDARFDVTLTYANVNRFSSDTQEYTVGFEGMSNNGSPLMLQLLLIKNFGSGGSATTTQTLTIFTISTALNTYQFSFTFGDNSAETIGPNDDDFIQLVLRPTVASTWDYTFTNFGIVFGAITAFNFPETTNQQFLYRSLNPPIPAYDGSNLALPILLGPAGLIYDTSNIGKVYSAVYSGAGYGELLCDGASYEYTGYSTDNIPYYRLGNILFNSGANAFQFGGGSTYINSYYAGGASTEFVFGNNAFGTVTATNAGTSGFTVATIHPASTTTYGVNSWVTSPSTLYIQNNESGNVSNATAGTSGFTVTELQNGNIYPRALFSVATLAATGLAGLYFTFQSVIATVATNFYVWFKVAGSGADPAPGGTGIEVDLNTADTAATVAFKIQLALTAGQVSTVILPAFAGITAGTQWQFNTPGQGFYVWYQTNGAGTDPAIGGRIGIPVNVLTGDTAAQVAFKTQTQVNKKYYGTPNLAGLFIRAFDATGKVDLDSALRASSVPGLSGNTIGSIQLDSNQSHSHATTAVTIGTGVGATGSGTNFPNAFIAPEGGIESRGLNMALNFIIKY